MYQNFNRYSIFYKLDKYNDFIESELILLNKYIYFDKLLDENKIKIRHKFKMNLMYLYKDNIINKDNDQVEILIK